MDVAADGFAGSESGRTKCARRVWAMDGPQQRTGTAASAITDMQAYMKYYDCVRLHSTLGYQTPLEYENDLNKVSGLA